MEELRIEYCKIDFDALDELIESMLYHSAVRQLALVDASMTSEVLMGGYYDLKIFKHQKRIACSLKFSIFNQ